jgi:hypothetical protein
MGAILPTYWRKQFFLFVLAPNMFVCYIHKFLNKYITKSSAELHVVAPGAAQSGADGGGKRDADIGGKQWRQMRVLLQWW